MALHPELVAYAADILAASDEPMGTGMLSGRLTTAMRRLVATGAVTEAEVMTRDTTAASGSYYEVAGRTIPAIIKAVNKLIPIHEFGAVYAWQIGAKRGPSDRRERHYMTVANHQRRVERLRSEAAERERVGERVRTRKIWSDANPGGFIVQVIADDRLVAVFVINEITGWEHSEPVLTERLGETFAFEQAEALARKVRIAMVDQAVAS